eukprot:TRINITY_DN4492_c0_g1_i1.p1 TRINITY_DN4492_c0_g1~~TRINITY_DN4492_c0_g1_i1.p1  ORF type:complete len:429 (-),score=100.82 TRINITY_DN4492_c0_g1_i1:129-1382(-)
MDVLECTECGYRTPTSGVLGVLICGSCGEIIDNSTSFDNALSEIELAAYVAGRSAQAEGVGRAEGQLRPRVEYSSLENQMAMHLKKTVRANLFKRELHKFAAALEVSDAVSEPAFRLGMRHGDRLLKFPRQPPALRRIAAACLYIVGCRQNMGFAMSEMAQRGGVHLGSLKKTVWKVCKAGGIRLRTNDAGNVESLLERISAAAQSQLPGARPLTGALRRAVCSMAASLLEVADASWLTTGRFWCANVVAAYVLSAEAYHVSIDLEGLVQRMGVGAGTVRYRTNELKAALITLMRPLPWGDVVTAANLSGYLPFVVDYREVLQSALPELKRLKQRKRQAEAPQPLPDAQRPRRAVAESQVEAAGDQAPQPLPDAQRPRRAVAESQVEAAGDQAALAILCDEDDGSAESEDAYASETA